MTGWRRRLLLVAGWVGLAWWAWAALGPSQLGGPVTYAIVSGPSMKPTLAHGDLVLVRPEERYGSGDVVAYRTKSGATILHRIIRRVGDGYVLQGDHNSWVDPYLPTREEMLGRLQRRIPKAGWVIEWLRRPLAASALVGVVSFLVGWRYQRRTSRAGAPEGVAMLAVVVVVGFSLPPPPAHAASNAVPPTRLGMVTRPITPDGLKPGACSGVAVAQLVSGSGEVRGSGANDLILAGPGVDDLRGRGGDDCLVGGGGDDDLEGEGGVDVCIGGPGVDVFEDCETAIQ